MILQNTSNHSKQVHDSNIFMFPYEQSNLYGSSSLTKTKNTATTLVLDVRSYQENMKNTGLKSQMMLDPFNQNTLAESTLSSKTHYEMDNTQDMKTKSVQTQELGNYTDLEVMNCDDGTCERQSRG